MDSNYLKKYIICSNILYNLSYQTINTAFCLLRPSFRPNTKSLIYEANLTETSVDTKTRMEDKINGINFDNHHTRSLCELHAN